MRQKISTPKNIGPLKNSQKACQSKWQYFVIIIALIFLGLNAMPNLYQQKDYLLVSEAMQETKKPQEALEIQNDSQLEYELTPLLHSQLNRNNFKVDSINSKGAITKIKLESQKDVADAHQFLTKELGTGYTVEIISEDTTPTWLTQLGSEKIKLGLDLNGGVLIVLKVDSGTAFTERLGFVKQSISSLVRENKIRGAKARLQVNQSDMTLHNIKLTFNESARPEASIDRLIKEMRIRFPNVTIEQTDSGQMKFYYSEIEFNKFHQEVMLQALTTLRGRIEQLGITEAVTQRQGKNKIRIELPGVKDPHEAERIIGATASLNFYQLQSRGGKIVKTKTGEPVSIAPNAIFSGKNIKNAQAGRDEMGMPLVNLTLDSEGGAKMLKFSSKNIGKPMATVFSEYYTNAKGEIEKKSKVISVATIQSQLGSRFSITNMDSPQAATELALLLRAGSLTAPITIVKKKAIDASLGKANIENGLAALLLGLGLTLVFMSLWYRRLGLIANGALLLNLVCLLGLMSLLPGAVLTLPGIAGLVLTIGMAVDTNVIIFERIKEERKQKCSFPVAIERGYKNAFATIFDANITTLITAFILFSIGYGPVKGFAITLGLGIITSLFTGVFISHVLTALFYKERENRTHNLAYKFKGENS